MRTQRSTKAIISAKRLKLYILRDRERLENVSLGGVVGVFYCKKHFLWKALFFIFPGVKTKAFMVLIQPLNEFFGTNRILSNIAAGYFS